jgi:RNA recognition motif-containing protein
MPKVNKNTAKQSKQKFLGCGTMTLTNKRDHDNLLKAGSFKFKGRKFFIKPYLVGEELAKFKEQIHRKRVFVHNIPKGISNEKLGEIFHVFGEVEDSYLIRSNKCRKYKASTRKYGYVIFAREEDARRAIRAKRVMHNSHKLLIMPFTKKDKRGGNQSSNDLNPAQNGRFNHSSAYKNMQMHPRLST